MDKEAIIQRVELAQGLYEVAKIEFFMDLSVATILVRDPSNIFALVYFELDDLENRIRALRDLLLLPTLKESERKALEYTVNLIDEADADFERWLEGARQ